MEEKHTLKKRKITDHYNRKVQKAAQYLGIVTSAMSEAVHTKKIDALKLVAMMEGFAKKCVARYGLKVALDGYSLYKALKERNLAESKFSCPIRDTALDKYFSRYDQTGVLKFTIAKKPIVKPIKRGDRGNQK